MEALEVLQNRVTVVGEAVVAAPLQITDLDRDLGELEGVGVYLDGFELLHADERLKLEAELGAEGDNFFFEVEQELERDVEEVAAAAGGVEHSDGGDLFLEGESLSRSAAILSADERSGEVGLIALHSRRSGAMRTGSTRVMMSSSLV